MRILRLDVERFGALSGASIELDPRAVVVLGPNEAGKSSFHAAFETLLYGFEPANRANHPYAQWDETGAPLHLEAEIVAGDGARLRLERHLASGPSLRTARPGEDFTGPRGRDNSALAGLEDVPRKLFRAVYSLTANDTTFYEDEVRSHVEDMLLGPKALADVRPVHLVREELDADRRRLWKPDRTGNHRAKQLVAARKEARAEVREARRRERELGEQLAERARLLEDESTLRAARATFAREAEELSFLAQVAEWRRRADAARPLRRSALESGESLVDPAALETRLAELDAELGPVRERLAATPPRLELTQRTLLHRADEVRAAGAERATHERDDAQRAVTLERAERASRHADEILARLGIEPELEEFPVERLRAGVETWRALIEERNAPPPRWPWAVAALGLLLIGLGLVDALPALAALPGLVLLLAPLLVRRGHGRPTGPPDDVSDTLDALLGAGRADGPQHPNDLDRIADELERARDLLREASEDRARVTALDRARIDRFERWTALALGVHVECAGIAPVELPALLLERLDEARAADAEVRAGLEARRRDQAARKRLEPERATLAARLERVRAALADSFPDLDDASAAHAAWLAAEREHDFLRERERELAAHERWEDLRDDPRLDLVPPPWDPDERARREGEASRLEARFDEVLQRLAELRKVLGEDDESHLARAEERLRQLDDELARVERQHDRLALLDAVLAEADRRHRETHQPDVLRRAGEYLAAITEGRYTLLSYPEGQEDTLHAESVERGEAVPVGPPMSRGAREQIYLCLRLGTLDHLDAERERLPLLLDEALVHWDEGRRRALYPLLASVSEVRQVVLFTCHPALAEEARELLGAHVVQLARADSEAARAPG